MPAYVIFIREKTHDVAELDAYKTAGNGLEGVPVRMLAAYGPQVVLEGPVPEGVAIAEFPNAKAVTDWYYSPEYQRALKHRLKGATYRAIIVDSV
ncbi:MAG: hypothetical protein JWO04_1372 [Gammaproteobacteria bacterium]|jgi:uncharacterized protein (DUF1330 family)|nr:hypothetical protein [Gammaproteobacteria bacterium]